MTAGTDLFNKKLKLNINATLDPYAITAEGKKINTFNINNNGSLFRLTNASLTMNYSLASSKSEGGKSSSQKNAEANNSDGIFGENLNASNDLSSKDNTSKKDTKTSKLYRATLPWTL
jgi:hypothetical protein